MGANQVLGSILWLLVLFGLAAGRVIIQQNSLDELFDEGNGVNALILNAKAEPEEYDAVDSRLHHPFNIFRKSTPILQPVVMELHIKTSVPEFGVRFVNNEGPQNIFPLPLPLFNVPSDYETPRYLPLFIHNGVEESVQNSENFDDFNRINDFMPKPVVYDLGSLISELLAKGDDNDSKDTELTDSDDTDFKDNGNDEMYKNIEKFEQGVVDNNDEDDKVKNDENSIDTITTVNYDDEQFENTEKSDVNEDPETTVTVDDVLDDLNDSKLFKLLFEMNDKMNNEEFLNEILQLSKIQSNKIENEYITSADNNVEKNEDSLQSEQRAVYNKDDDAILQSNEHIDENEPKNPITSINSEHSDENEPKDPITSINSDNDGDVTSGDIKPIYYFKVKESAESNENTQVSLDENQLGPQDLEIDDNVPLIYLKSSNEDASKESAESNEKTEVPLSLNRNFYYNTNIEAKNIDEKLEVEANNESPNESFDKFIENFNQERLGGSSNQLAVEDEYDDEILKLFLKNSSEKINENLEPMVDNIFHNTVSDNENFQYTDKFNADIFDFQR